MKKRYSAVDLTDLAVGILVLGIVVVIGARLLITYRNSRLTDLSTDVVANESTAIVVNYTGITLDTAWVSSVGDCYNNTGAGEVIPTTNYTTSVDPGNGIVTITGDPDPSYNNTVWNCTYTVYNITSPQWTLPDSASIGLAEYGNWFDIIVIIGIAGLILALIFMAFGRRGDEGGVAY